MRIWIDTDIGSDVDDALALAYVLRRPDLELLGVSTVFGDVAVRSAVARRLLALGGAGEVPVLDGLGVPRTAGKPGRMFGHEGQGLIEVPEPRRRVTEETDGARRVATLAAALRDARPDVLLAIGPLTNIAALVQAGVELPPLAIMGGKLTDVVLDGMPTGFAEWNWFCDPEAVQIVLGAHHSRPPVVVPAEITFRTALAEADLVALDDGDELTRALGGLCRRWLEVQRDTFRHDRPRVLLHDPLTAAVLVEPSLCRFAERSIRVDGDGAAHHDGPGTTMVRAAVDVDPDAVRAHLSAWLVGNGNV